MESLGQSERTHERCVALLQRDLETSPQPWHAQGRTSRTDPGIQARLSPTPRTPPGEAFAFAFVFSRLAFVAAETAVEQSRTGWPLAHRLIVPFVVLTHHLIVPFVVLTHHLIVSLYFVIPLLRDTARVVQHSARADLLNATLKNCLHRTSECARIHVACHGHVNRNAVRDTNVARTRDLPTWLGFPTCGRSADPRRGRPAPHARCTRARARPRARVPARSLSPTRFLVAPTAILPIETSHRCTVPFGFVVYSTGSCWVTFCARSESAARAA